MSPTGKPLDAAALQTVLEEAVRPDGEPHVHVFEPQHDLRTALLDLTKAGERLRDMTAAWRQRGGLWLKERDLAEADFARQLIKARAALKEQPHE